MNLHIWQKDWKVIKKKHPHWQLDTQNGIPTAIKGNLRLFQGDYYVGDYDIIIGIPKGYPHAFPSLYEVGGKIPRIADRHIYTQNGGCCVEITHKQQIIAHRGIKICEFIDKYVVPYFLNDIHFTNWGTYANGEWEHGFNGHLQFYIETLKSDDGYFILRVLEYLLNPPPQMPKLCICGSGRRFKRCHESQLLMLKKVDKETLILDYEIIMRCLLENSIKENLILKAIYNQKSL